MDRPIVYKPSLNLESAALILDPTERMLAVALCSLAHLRVYHEPYEIVAPVPGNLPKSATNEQKSTVPDFLVRWALEPTDLYLEVCEANFESSQHKQRQRRVMERANLPGALYLQLSAAEVTKFSDSINQEQLQPIRVIDVHALLLLLLEQRQS